MQYVDTLGCPQEEWKLKLEDVVHCETSQPQKNKYNIIILTR